MEMRNRASHYSLLIIADITAEILKAYIALSIYIVFNIPYDNNHMFYFLEANNYIGFSLTFN